MLVLAGLAVLTWRTASLQQTDQRLRLTVLPGDGETAVLIQAPGWQIVLINGGASAPALAQALGERQPPFQRGLDALLVMRASYGSLNALPETVKLYPPGLALWVCDPLATQAGMDTRVALLSTGGRIQAAQARHGAPAEPRDPPAHARLPRQ